MHESTLAQKIIAEHGTNNPFAVCKALGIEVLRVPLVDIRGFYMQSGGVDIICVDDSLCPTTARFVCAHELFHKLRHSHLNRVFMDTCTRMVPDKYENEADRFAYYFNFPADDGYLLFSELTMWEMADALNVAPAKVKGRIRELCEDNAPPI